MYFLFGFFMFSAFTVFFIIILDIGKERESKKEGKVLGGWIGVCYGFMLLGKATSEFIYDNYDIVTTIWACCGAGIVMLLFAFIATILLK